MKETEKLFQACFYQILTQFSTTFISSLSENKAFALGCLLSAAMLWLFLNVVNLWLFLVVD